MGQLERVKTKAEGLASKICLYGLEAEGKSSLAAQFPKPIFLMGRGETGLLSLLSSGQLKDVAYLPGKTTDALDSWFELTEGLKALMHEKHDYKTVVIDSWSAFERLLTEYLVEKEFKGEWGERGFMSYGKGWAAVQRETAALFDAYLDRLQLEKKMTIIIIAHTAVKTFKNPEDMDYDRYTGSANEKAWQVIKEKCDEVWFMNTCVEVMQDGNRGKGQGEGTRYLFTRRHAAWDAKSRKGLPPKIKLGKSAAESYAAIRAALNGKGE